MFIEQKKEGKKVKYYLAHSYREKGKVKKIRKYLGVDLSENELIKRKEDTKEFILEQINANNTKVFDFELTPKEIERLNKISEINVIHLYNTDWKKFTEEFVYNTNAIEGSTVELNEVKEILKDKPKTNDAEELETLGVAGAIKFIRDTNEQINLDFLLKLHKLCFEKSKSFAGKFRGVQVVIKNSYGEIIHIGTPINKLNNALNELVVWYKENKAKFNPLILATIMHNQFEHIHPFQDGNGRVGRLLLNYILIRNNYPPINIYLEDRQRYYKALQVYSQFHDIKPMLEFLVKQYKKEIKGGLQKRKKR
ncbi:MAG TPA: Fic family protein [Candidatus Nanoarchaeia archaeon]|nr:Fic family protein [Candidatus Nanoarchaeia archaeon]